MVEIGNKFLCLEFMLLLGFSFIVGKRVLEGLGVCVVEREVRKIFVVGEFEVFWSLYLVFRFLYIFVFS